MQLYSHTKLSVY